MQKRFDDEAKKSIDLSKQEAFKFSHNYIGIEHLTLGTIRHDNQTISKLFKKLDISIDLVRAKVESYCRSLSITKVSSMDSIPMNEQVERVLKLTYMEALLLDDDIITSNHLLLSIINNNDSIIKHILSYFNIKYEELQILVASENYSNDKPTMNHVSLSKNDYKPSIFISYNHADRIVADKLNNFLKNKGFDVLIDYEAMKTSEDIKLFIEKCVRKCDITLSIVSKNSLLSAWVAMESILTLQSEKFTKKKFFAVYNDNSFFSRSFVRIGIEKVREELKDIDYEMKYRIEQGIGTEDLQNERTRYKQLENSLPEIVRRLRESLCVDISNNNFHKGIEKIIKDIT